MGLNFDYVLDQPFKTQNHFQNDQFIHSNSSPRRHTTLRLRAAALLQCGKFRLRRRRLSAQCGKDGNKNWIFPHNCEEVEASSRFVWATV